MTVSDTELEEHVDQTAQARPHGHPSVKEYVRIGMILAVVTAAEVVTYYARSSLGGWLIPILFSLSLIKFTLVVLWFMHLKFDSRMYSRFFVMGLAGAVTLYLVVLTTFRIFLR